MLLYRKALQEESKPNADSVIFRLYCIVIGIYAGIQFFISFLLRIPAFHLLTNQCDRWPLIRFVKWMRQVLFLFSCNLFILLTPGFVVSICFLYIHLFIVFVHQRNGIMLDEACLRGLLILSSNPNPNCPTSLSLSLSLYIYIYIYIRAKLRLCFVGAVH